MAASETAVDVKRDAADHPALMVGPKPAARILGVSIAKWHAMNAGGQVPKPVRFGGRCPRWSVDELRQWIEAGCPSRDQWEKIKAKRRTA